MTGPKKIRFTPPNTKEGTHLLDEEGERVDLLRMVLEKLRATMDLMNVQPTIRHSPTSESLETMMKEIDGYLAIIENHTDG